MLYLLKDFVREVHHGKVFADFWDIFGPKWAIWAIWARAHGPLGARAHGPMGPGRFWRFLVFGTFWICQPNTCFWIFGSLVAPSDFFFARNMMAIGSSSFDKFIETCQICFFFLS